MKQIIILSEKLTNFMGVPHFETEFSHSQAMYCGENGTGKTTLATAFFWVLWGKDMAGRSDTKFCVKPLDSYNQTDRDVVTEVEITLSVDGEVIKLKRTYKEIWATKRGDCEAKYQGNETCRYWNDVLKKEREYSQLVNTEICDETLFRQVTDPIYFFSQTPKEQRKFLVDLAGNVTPESIVQNHPEFAPVVSELSATKSLQEYKEQVQQTIKRIKADAETIPARIDERKRDMPEAEDWSALEAEIASVKATLDSLDNQMLDKSKALDEEERKRNERNVRINTLRSQILSIQNAQSEAKRKEYTEAFKAYSDAKVEHSRLTSQKNVLQSEIQNREKENETLANKKQELLEQYFEIKNRTLEFDESQFVCPTCKRPLDADNKEEKRKEMENAFNAKKSRDTDENVSNGKALASRIKGNEATIEIKKSLLADCISSIDKIAVKVVEPVFEQTEPVDTPEIVAIRAEIEELQKQATDTAPADDAESQRLKEERASAQNTLNLLTERLSVRTYITNNQKRIDELQANYSAIQIELAKQNGVLDLINRYNKTYMGQVEASVNLMFNIIEFKLFEKQINEGERECCEAMVDGVPYSTNVNTASRINAGLDFVYSVQKKYDICAPVWIDNGESVTNILLDSNCQTIRLVKDSNYKSLTKVL